MDVETILHEIAPLRSCDGVLRWALAQTPPAVFVDVVVQDEFSHDVVVRVTPCLYIVFGTS